MGHQFLLNVPILIEADLDAIVMYILQQFPRSGYRRVIGYLLARRYRVQEKRVRESMRRVDPEVVIEKSISPNIIQRRRYSVPSPMALWHKDGHYKLARYNPLHTCISTFCSDS